MTSYRVAPGVHWVVGRATLTVTGANGTAVTLGYPDAAVWDFVSRGYAVRDVERLIAPLAALEPAAAAAVVRTAIGKWIESGFLQRA